MATSRASVALGRVIRDRGMATVRALLGAGVGEGVGPPRQQLAAWSRGDYTPRIEAALEIERVLEIPIADWTARPGSRRAAARGARA